MCVRKILKIGEVIVKKSEINYKTTAKENTFCREFSSELTKSASKNPPKIEEQNKLNKIKSVYLKTPCVCLSRPLAESTTTKLFLLFVKKVKNNNNLFGAATNDGGEANDP